MEQQLLSDCSLLHNKPNILMYVLVGQEICIYNISVLWTCISSTGPLFPYVAKCL